MELWSSSIQYVLMYWLLISWWVLKYSNSLPFGKTFEGFEKLPWSRTLSWSGSFQCSALPALLQYWRRILNAILEMPAIPWLFWITCKYIPLSLILPLVLSFPVEKVAWLLREAASGCLHVGIAGWGGERHMLAFQKTSLNLKKETIWFCCFALV